MTAILRYEADAEAQNGNHEVAVIPDNSSVLAGALAAPAPQTQTPPATVTPNNSPVYKSLGAVQRALETVQRRVKPNAVGVSLRQLANEWVTNLSVSPTTKPKQASRLKTCSRHLNFDLDVAHVGTEELNIALNELRKTCKESYIHDLWKKCLFPILESAVEQGLIERLPKLKLLKKSTVGTTSTGMERSPRNFRAHGC